MIANLQKIKISPESANYNDNDENVAYLYRGYIIWKYTNEHGPRGGRSHEWHYGQACLVTPDASLGEDFEPYWDDDGCTKFGESRSDCIACIDRSFEQGWFAHATEEASEADEDSLPVTLTVTKAQARTILAALSRRCNELDILGGQDAEALSKETREIYQSVDGQVYGVKS